MAKKTSEKREDLKVRLIEAARNRIAAEGLANLRARDVTQDAGCALGGLYTVFSDLDDLIMHVNSMTLSALEASLNLAETRNQSSVERLRALSLGYLHFALTHRNLWKALFDHRPADGQQTPEWHRQEHMFLMEIIAEPLVTLRPDMSPQARAIRARTLFGAVHGIITISLEGRFVGLPVESLERELEDFIHIVAAGTAAK